LLLTSNRIALVNDLALPADTRLGHRAKGIPG
jgi:hypothetical protein